MILMGKTSFEHILLNFNIKPPLQNININFHPLALSDSKNAQLLNI